MALAFTILTVFNILLQPIRQLPVFIGKFIQFSVGMRRIQKFLLSKELSLLKNVQDSEEAVKVDGSFNWGNNIYDHATLLEKRKSLGAKTED